MGGQVLICAQCGRQYMEPTNRCSVDGSALCSPVALKRVGSALGNYDLLSIEGVGGMGIVYKGRHHILGKPVAVKVLHERFAQRDGAVDQFLREAQAATRIRHPNIVDVTDFGISPDGSVYFVMEHLEGISLETVLARDGHVQLFNAVNIVRQIARALAAAHDEGIVHRDLKPENIFLVNREGRRRVLRAVRDGGEQRFVIEKEGNFDFVKLLDFGVAKYTMDDVGPGMSTRAGMIFGTPHYMSPEQARGELVDGRSDVYALGIVFYEMITGVVPFDGEAALDILNGHVYGTVIQPKERNPLINVDEGTNRTIVHCLEKDPADRYQTMWELIDGLASCFTDQVFLRDAHRMPGALEAGIAVPPRGRPITGVRPAVNDTDARGESITSELNELFSRPTPAAPPAEAAAAGDGAIPLVTPKRTTEPHQPAKDKDRRRSGTSPGVGAVSSSVKPLPSNGAPKRR
jgi:eukaryotic-like serine/threonine-protein kinase